MKTLIVYYSFTHNNELLANELQRPLDADIIRIEEARRRNGFTILLDLAFSRTPVIKRPHIPSGIYGHFVFISPIWASRIASPLKAFLLNERSKISDYSFVTLCGGRPGQKEKVSKELTRLVGRDPSQVVELWLTNLKSGDAKDNAKHNVPFRLRAEDLSGFRRDLEVFAQKIRPRNELTVAQ